jgi:hypothetical protein
MAFPNPDLVYTDYNGSLYDLVANQIQEMELVRSKIFQLEQTHMQMKQKYVLGILSLSLATGAN